MSGGERFASCCISFGIGLLQLLTTVFCFIGWIWSCVWGGFFIVTSGNYNVYQGPVVKNLRRR